METEHDALEALLFGRDLEHREGCTVHIDADHLATTIDENARRAPRGPRQFVGKQARAGDGFQGGFDLLRRIRHHNGRARLVRPIDRRIDLRLEEVENPRQAKEYDERQAEQPCKKMPAPDRSPVGPERGADVLHDPLLIA